MDNPFLPVESSTGGDDILLLCRSILASLFLGDDSWPYSAGVSTSIEDMMYIFVSARKINMAVFKL